MHLYPANTLSPPPLHPSKVESPCQARLTWPCAQRQTSTPYPSPTRSFNGMGRGDLPVLMEFGDQPASPWDSDAEKCLNELASPQPPRMTPPPSPPLSSPSCTPPVPLPEVVTSSPSPQAPQIPLTVYEVALAALQEALTSTAVPPPSPPRPPKYVPKDPQPPPKTHSSRALHWSGCVRSTGNKCHILWTGY